jgi:hypothetical protein
MPNATKKNERRSTLKSPQSLVRHRLRTLMSAALSGTHSASMDVRRAENGLLSNGPAREKSV